MSYRQVTRERRQDIVRRVHGNGETCVTLARIRTPDELAYAIRVLTDHYTYKRARYDEGKLNSDAAHGARDALNEAANTFHAEIGQGLGLMHPANGHFDPVADHGPASLLGDGEIANPYNLVHDD